MLTLQRTFHGMRQSSWRYCRSHLFYSFTHKVTNPPESIRPTWYMVATEDRMGRTIRTPEAVNQTSTKAKTVEVESEPCGLHVAPKGNRRADREAASSVNE